QPRNDGRGDAAKLADARESVLAIPRAFDHERTDADDGQGLERSSSLNGASGLSQLLAVVERLVPDVGSADAVPRVALDVGDHRRGRGRAGEFGVRELPRLRGADVVVA